VFHRFTASGCCLVDHRGWLLPTWLHHPKHHLIYALPLFFSGVWRVDWFTHGRGSLENLAYTNLTTEGGRFVLARFGYIAHTRNANFCSLTSLWNVFRWSGKKRRPLMLPLREHLRKVPWIDFFKRSIVKDNVCFPVFQIPTDFKHSA
jgi:hypothetical protein